MKTLIFVYNAKSGVGNLVMDVAHKLFSPKTYACNLCALTYNTFSENTTWKAFREKSNIDFEFLHIDEFEIKYPNQPFEYPVILKKTDTDLEVFLSKERLESLPNLEILITTIEAQAIG